MNRKETTTLLTEILIHDRLLDRKYYAKEVTLDANTMHSTRVDVMQFVPNGVIYTSDIEKGIFICYEIKSCLDDIFSGNGLNFIGEKTILLRRWTHIRSSKLNSLMELSMNLWQKSIITNALTLE